MNVALVLGKKCNLHCKYCNNHTMNIAEDCDVTDTALMYMRAVADKILYYGGEPLLYWDDIIKTVEYCPDAKHTTFTNGKILNSDKVRYCNEKNIKVMVSYDGENSEETRGYNALKSNRSNIIMLNDLVIYSVITTKNYIKGVLDELAELEKEYYDIHGYYFQINLAPLKPAKYTVGLDNFDYQRINNEINEVIAGYDTNETYKVYLDGLFEIFSQGVRGNELFCGFGSYYVAIDRKGNYFPCQGYDTVIGNVINTSIAEAMDLSAYDQYPERYTERCAECTALELCKNGCNCYKEDELFVFCMLRRVLYTPIIQFFKSKMGLG